jgi:hypothetical protein
MKKLHSLALLIVLLSLAWYILKNQSDVQGDFKMTKFNLSKMTLLAVVATTLLSSEVIFAAESLKQVLHTNKIEALEDPYFQIQSVTSTEISDKEADKLLLKAKRVSPELTLGITPGITPNDTNLPGTGPETKPKTGVIDGVIMVVDQLIAIGQKLIPIIDKGRAVVNNNPMGAVAVLPRLDKTAKEVHDMANWSLPTTKHYKIVYTNGWGSDVVTFVYSVTFQHNGTFEGKGKYLTGIRASARQIDVSWGFDLDASSQLLQISNVGTSENLIAAATLEISYTVKNWTRTVTNNVSYFVTGDGSMYKLD